MMVGEGLAPPAVHGFATPPLTNTGRGAPMCAPVMPKTISKIFLLFIFKEVFATQKHLIVVRALKAAPDTAGRRLGCQGDSASPPDNPQRSPTAVSSRGISSGKLYPIRER